ncbi:unnamed protein product [Boreogadus saida]
MVQLVAPGLEVFLRLQRRVTLKDSHESCQQLNMLCNGNVCNAGEHNKVDRQLSRLVASGWPPRAARLSKMGRLRRRKRRIWVDARRNGDIPGPETKGCLTRGLRRGGVQGRVTGSVCCLRNDTPGHH